MRASTALCYENTPASAVLLSPLGGQVLLALGCGGSVSWNNDWAIRNEQILYIPVQQDFDDKKEEGRRDDKVTIIVGSAGDRGITATAAVPVESIL